MDEETKILHKLENEYKNIDTLNDKWISDFANLIHKCFKSETRKAIRLKAIATLSQIFNTYCVIYEDQLMEKLIIQNFANIDQENDLEIRKPIVHLLFDVASNCLSPKNCVDVLAIVRKILIKPFKMTLIGGDASSDVVYIFGNADVIDNRLAITNLHKLLKTKLYSLPIDPAVTILDILVNYLNLIYKCPLQSPVPAEIPMILQELFSLFLNFRCDEHGYVGIKLQNHSDRIRYSPFLTCVKRPSTTSRNSSSSNISNSSKSDSPAHPPASTPIISSDQQSILVSNVTSPNGHPETRCINLDGILAGIVICINSETHFEVLSIVLERLPDLLTNKSLISTAPNELINQLSMSLSDLTRNIERRFSRTNQKCEIVHHCLKSLTSLLVYRNVLEQRSIKFLLAAFGDSLKISQHVVSLFSTCLIELKDVQEMTRFLPQVLDKLSKFSATIQLATCRLEFLSYLILFPKLYENFSSDEYICIFATALPYTNPFKFSDYVTCLAFRVIAMWYLKCRPSLRSTFVNFIKKSLQSNVIQPFKENPIAPYSPTSTHPSQPLPITHSCPPATSYDQRKRSCSLNTENNLKRSEYRQGSVTSIMLHLSKVPSSPPPPNSPSSPFSFNSAGTSAFGFPNNQLSLQLNEELIETFSDLLSRYTHGQCSMTPIQQMTCGEYFIDKNSTNSQTWLHGNSLVTITTSSQNLGWAEILIRRPTGNMSWIGRLENSAYSVNGINSSDIQSNVRNDVISLFSAMALTDDIFVPDSGFNSAATPVSASTPSAEAGSISSQGYKLVQDPIYLPKDGKTELALKNFDRITPYETHKIGVVYVGKGQADNKVEILGNNFGSLLYMEFLKRLGLFINLSEIDNKVHFIGGLDTKGEDGKYTYYWQDNITQVIFHVATLMPNRNDDPRCNNKHKHIGNDHVCIVYNDSRERFQLSTIKGDGQCIMACIVITPLEPDTNLVTVDMCPEMLQIFSATEARIITNNALSLYVRQLAIHLNLASMIYERRQRSAASEQSNGHPIVKSQYVSNWVERLRCIKRIRKRLEDSQVGSK